MNRTFIGTRAKAIAINVIVFLISILVFFLFPFNSRTIAIAPSHYEEISKKYPQIKLSPERVKQFEMQGDCLVSLKQINFKKNRDFDPIAEWSNFRSISLLEQFPPCEVLIMIEIAKKQLDEIEAQN